MAVVIQPASELSSDALAPLVVESEQAGWRFVRRLADDLRTGANRFEGDGERLFEAVSDGTVVGVCGLNVDPYAANPLVGRVRHLYVLASYRGRGVGKKLVQAVVVAASGRFRRLRVRTVNPLGGRLYERLGFVPVTDAADCTHSLELAGRAN